MPKSVLVTGANKGIGFSIVKGLVADGITTFLGSRNAELGEAAKASLSEEQAKLVTVVQLDVTSEASVAAAVDTIKAALDGAPLTGLVNNAGGAFGGAMGFTSAKDWEATMELNYWGSTVRVTEAFLPLLDQSGAGRVVMVGSGAAPTFVSKCSAEKQAQLCEWDVTSLEGLKAIYEESSAIVAKHGDDKEATEAAFAAAGLSDGAPYNFSKALMAGYSQVLQKRYPSQLVCNACSPGFIETDLTRGFADKMGKTPTEMGMKPPADGARCPLFLAIGAPEGRGWYYGSDCLRSPMDKYRSPGDPEYKGGESQASAKSFAN